MASDEAITVTCRECGGILPKMRMSNIRGTFCSLPCINAATERGWALGADRSNLRQRIAELEAENAKLCETVDSLYRTQGQADERVLHTLAAALAACRVKCWACKGKPDPREKCTICGDAGSYICDEPLALARAVQEACAARMETGEFCRKADHMQGACECAERAAAIRAIDLGREGER